MYIPILPLEVVKNVKSGNPYRDSSGKFDTGGTSQKPGTKRITRKQYDALVAKRSKAKKELKYKSSTTKSKTLEKLSSLGKLSNEGAGFKKEFDKNGDSAMKSITKSQGFDKKPAKYTKKEAKQAVKDGAVEMFRGYRTKDATKFKKSYANDKDLRVGYGIYGSGTYMTSNKSVATFYAEDVSEKNVGNYIISAKAKGITYTKAKKSMMAEYTKTQKEYTSIAKSLPSSERKQLQDNIKVVYSDVGRWAAVSGYDYINYKGSAGAEEMTVLNRGVVGVVE